MHQLDHSPAVVSLAMVRHIPVLRASIWSSHQGDWTERRIIGIRWIPASEDVGESFPFMLPVVLRNAAETTQMEMRLRAKAAGSGLAGTPSRVAFPITGRCGFPVAGYDII